MYVHRKVRKASFFLALVKFDSFTTLHKTLLLSKLYCCKIPHIRTFGPKLL